MGQTSLSERKHTPWSAGLQQLGQLSPPALGELRGRMGVDGKSKSSVPWGPTGRPSAPTQRVGDRLAPWGAEPREVQWRATGPHPSSSLGERICSKDKQRARKQKRVGDSDFHCPPSPSRCLEMRQTCGGEVTAGETRPGTKDAPPGSPSLRGLTSSSPRPAHLQTPGLTS